MKILFFITVGGHGNGGHAHSLLHISKEIGKYHDIKIVSIGSGVTDFVSLNPHFLNHVKFYGYNVFYLFNEIDKIIKEFDPDIYHFFDFFSYNILRLKIGSGKKVVLNVCGGPNQSIFPFVNNLILFSQENYSYYKRLKKLSQSNIHLIPNRVNRILIPDFKRLILKDTDSFNFVRICRIGTHYRKSLKDSLNLIHYLKRKSINAKLYIIGVVESQNIYDELKNDMEDTPDDVTILIEKEFTQGASKMLYLADAVIGTGRGIMEAASLGLPLLTINAEDNFPVLINEKNFINVFKTNFSERNKIELFNQEENLNNIEFMIKEKNYYNQLSRFSEDCFNKYFNVEKVLQEYDYVYDHAKSGSNKNIHDLRNILWAFKHFYMLYIQNRKRENFEIKNEAV